MKCKGTFTANIDVDIKDEQKKSAKVSKEKLSGKFCGWCMFFIIVCILAVLVGVGFISCKYFSKNNTSANPFLPVPENSVSENVTVETSFVTIFVDNESLKNVEPKNKSMDWFLYSVLMAACVWAVCFLCFLLKDLCVKASKLRYLRNAFDCSAGNEEAVEIENRTEKKEMSENQSEKSPKSVVTSKKQIPSMERFKTYANTLTEI